MEIPFYTAMTPQEISQSKVLPSNVAWMSIRFNPIGEGLTQIPSILPAESVLIVDDYYPITTHNVDKLCRELSEVIKALTPAGVLLDFQREKDEKLLVLTEKISQTAPCKVAVSPQYAQESAIVFLPPLDHVQALSEYLKPWQDFEIWLDLSTQATCVTVSDKAEICEKTDIITFPFYNETFFTHYAVKKRENSFLFSFRRNYEDCMKLLAEASKQHVTAGFGLYSEIKPPR